MNSLFSVASFAVAYGVGLEVITLVDIYHFGIWDPKFHDQAGNVAFFHQVLSVLVMVASLSFFVGWLSHAKAMRRASRVKVVVTGTATGLLATLLALVPKPADSEVMLGQLMFFGGPALCAALLFGIARMFSAQSGLGE